MVYWYEFVYSPVGFYGKDVVIDAISALVALLIGFFAFKNYLLDKKANKKHLFFSAGFGLLTLSFLMKILTNVVTHREDVMSGRFFLRFLGIEIIQPIGWFSALGFLTYAILTLFGFYLIFYLTSKETKLTMNTIIILYLLVVTTYFTRVDYVFFFLTAFLFTFAVARRYFISYKQNKVKNTLLLGYSFSIISLSQLVFAFASTNRFLYILAEIIQLVGYLLLLYIFISVLHYARKKN